MTAGSGSAGTATMVTMPRLSDSMEEGTIVAWLVADGETVGRGQEIVEIETDKATVGYDSPAAGPLHIIAASGAAVPVGEPIAQVGDGPPAAPGGGSNGEDPAASEPVEPAPAAAAEAGPETDGAARVSPVARRLAASRGIDVATIAGTGPAGRILKADVLAALAASGPSTAGARGASRRQEPSRIQQLIARRMAEARATIPEFPVSIEVEAAAAVAFRAQLAGLDEPPPSYNDLVVAAVARALPGHPRLNASYTDAGFEFFEQVNIGIAVASGEDLIVPTIERADQLTLAEIAAASRRLAERVRSGAVTPPELAGGTFTVSNLGMYGITSFQPIINPPQAAILGVGAIRESSVTPPSMTLTLVSDHRIVYGADAAGFLAAVRKLLQNPVRLLVSPRRERTTA